MMKLKLRIKEPSIIFLVVYKERRIFLSKSFLNRLETLDVRYSYSYIFFFLLLYLILLENKIDLLLQRLTHRQLHMLVKDSIDKEADLAGQIRQMILDQRKIKEGLPSVPERVNIEPLGSGDDLPEEEEEQQKPEEKKPDTPADFVADMKRGGSSAPRGGPRGGPAGPRGGPVKNLKAAKANAAAGGSGGSDLMSQLKKAVGGGGLRYFFHCFHSFTSFFHFLNLFVSFF